MSCGRNLARGAQALQSGTVKKPSVSGQEVFSGGIAAEPGRLLSGKRGRGRRKSFVVMDDLFFSLEKITAPGIIFHRPDFRPLAVEVANGLFGLSVE